MVHVSPCPQVASRVHAGQLSCWARQVDYEQVSKTTGQSPNKKWATKDLHGSEVEQDVAPPWEPIMSKEEWKTEDPDGKNKKNLC